LRLHHPCQPQGQDESSTKAASTLPRYQFVFKKKLGNETTVDRADRRDSVAAAAAAAAPLTAAVTVVERRDYHQDRLYFFFEELSLGG
jgi:hypothetical protein